MITVDLQRPQVLLLVLLVGDGRALLLEEEVLFVLVPVMPALEPRRLAAHEGPQHLEQTDNEKSMSRQAFDETAARRAVVSQVSTLRSVVRRRQGSRRFDLVTVGRYRALLLTCSSWSLAVPGRRLAMVVRRRSRRSRSSERRARSCDKYTATDRRAGVSERSVRGGEQLQQDVMKR